MGPPFGRRFTEEARGASGGRAARPEMHPPEAPALGVDRGPGGRERSTVGRDQLRVGPRTSAGLPPRLPDHWPRGSSLPSRRAALPHWNPSFRNCGPVGPDPGPDDSYRGPLDPDPGPDDSYPGPVDPDPGPDDSYRGPLDPDPGPDGLYRGPVDPDPGPDDLYPGPVDPDLGTDLWDRVAVRPPRSRPPLSSGPRAAWRIGLLGDAFPA